MQRLQRCRRGAQGSFDVVLKLQRGHSVIPSHTAVLVHQEVRGEIPRDILAIRPALEVLIQVATVVAVDGGNREHRELDAFLGDKRRHLCVGVTLLAKFGRGYSNDLESFLSKRPMQLVKLLVVLGRLASEGGYVRHESDLAFQRRHVVRSPLDSGGRERVEVGKCACGGHGDGSDWTGCGEKV